MQWLEEKLWIENEDEYGGANLPNLIAQKLDNNLSVGRFHSRELEADLVDIGVAERHPKCEVIRSLDHGVPFAPGVARRLLDLV